MEFKGKNNKKFRGVVWMDYIAKAEICDKSKVYLGCMKKIPILIMLDNGRIGYKEIEEELEGLKSDSNTKGCKYAVCEGDGKANEAR